MQSRASDYGPHPPIHFTAARDKTPSTVQIQDAHVRHAPGEPCFPASAAVKVLRDGEVSQATINQLSVGDMVMARPFY